MIEGFRTGQRIWPALAGLLVGFISMVECRKMIDIGIFFYKSEMTNASGRVWERKKVYLYVVCKRVRIHSQ